MNRKVHVSIGIFVHNEERNIQRLLQSIESQKLETVIIDEVIIISSGSLDQTNRIARKWLKKFKRGILIDEVKRKGKSAAINVFISRAKSDILITVSGDLRLQLQAIEEIGLPFLNQEIGMVGARPKPLNVKQNQIGEEIRLLWELHHQISLLRPKCGEMVAFRNIIRQIPQESAVDEATIEVLLQLVGYHVVYAPRSIVYNKGPRTWREYVTQRRRVFAGHQWIAQRYNYQVVTMIPGQLLRVILLKILTRPTDWYPLTRLVLMEVWSRLMGYIDYHVLKRNPFVWRMISR